MLEAIFFAVLFIFPLHWAAEYAEAENSNYLTCFILSIVTTVVNICVMALLAAPPLSTLTAVIISIVICMKVLKIPSSNFFMFAVMLAFLNLIISGSATIIINGMLGR